MSSAVWRPYEVDSRAAYMAGETWGLSPAKPDYRSPSMAEDNAPVLVYVSRFGGGVNTVFQHFSRENRSNPAGFLAAITQRLEL